MLHAEGAYPYRGAANHRAAWLRHARMSIGRGCCAVPNAESGMLISW